MERGKEGERFRGAGLGWGVSENASQLWGGGGEEGKAN